MAPQRTTQRVDEFDGREELSRSPAGAGAFARNNLPADAVFDESRQ